MLVRGEPSVGVTTPAVNRARFHVLGPAAAEPPGPTTRLYSRCRTSAFCCSAGLRGLFAVATLVVTPLRELVATRSVIASAAAAAARANGDACTPPSPPAPPALIRKRG